jgi:hypothetical protein
VSEEKGKKRQLNSRSEEKKTKKRIFGPLTGVQIFTGEKEDFADGGNRSEPHALNYCGPMALSSTYGPEVH